MLKIRLLILTLGCLTPIVVFAQITDSTKDDAPAEDKIRQGTLTEQAARGEIPLSFADGSLQPNSNKIRRLPPTNLPDQPAGPVKIRQNGVIRNLEPAVHLSKDSTVFDVAGGRVYLVSVSAEGAHSVRVKFEKVRLPDGARIFVFPSGDQDDFYGPFNKSTPLADGSFWTPPVEGDRIIVELFVPSGAEDTDYFQINEISHIFTGRDECSSLFPPGPCNLEVTAAYTNMATAVGYLEFMTTQGSFICTGTLMTAASGNLAPFLMTANHCFSTQASAQSLRAYWNYNTGDSPPGGTAFTDGANLLSTSTQTDFTFVRMTGTVPGGLSYAGWDGADFPAITSIVGIHHPQGSHKRISFGMTNAIGSICTSLPSACTNFIPVTWSSGTTEGGSSGSGIFYTVANGGRYIGSLYGGFASCGSPTSPDWYGRFGLTYGKVATYLADGNCTYGVSPISNNFSAAGENGSFDVTTGGACYRSAVRTQPTTVQTFSNVNSISITDRPTNTSPPGVGSLYPSTIVVNGLSGTVTRVRVSLNGLTHTFPDDLDFLLVGPGGQRVLLVSDAGGGTDISNTNYTIDQAGLTLFSDGAVNSAGGYRPSNYPGLASVDTGGTDNFPAPGPGQTTYDNLLSDLTGTNPNGTWSLYIADDEAGDNGTLSGGWSLELATNNSSWLTITSGGNGYGNGTVNYSVAPNPVGGPARTGIINVAGQTHTVMQTAGTTTVNKTPFDFDGDSKTDISIYRPSVGQWWISRSSGNAVVYAFGVSSDRITPADFTGDGKADVAFFRPSSGEWFILRSENASFYSFPFGTNGDIPAPADYDGDGKADPAVFRPSNNTWYILRSTGGTTIQTFGTTGDKPVPADYDGDGKADIAIYRPSLGQWWMNRSTAGVLAVTFGISTDKPVPGDYTGDGKADVAFWRPLSGEWFILRSENMTFYSFPFGTNGDTPTPGDYDGDGRSDAAVFRPSATTWYVNRSTAGVLIQSFGFLTDQPVPSAFVP